jgi:1-aminocyclopropane-1-carboxylate deaminase
VNTIAAKVSPPDVISITGGLAIVYGASKFSRIEGGRSGRVDWAKPPIRSAALMMLAKFARYPLTFGPTPIEKLSRLSEHLGGSVELYAKREDCNSGLAFGGNKIRKLEYIVPDAIASNADTLVTIGGVQSNHTRQVAAVAAKLGMKCRLVQESWVPFPDAVYDRVGNILMSRIMGAEIELVDEGFDIGIRESWERAIADVKAKGGKPYAIPAGASVHKLGGLGFVGFAEEVRAQEIQLGFTFDYIIVCTVTGSTHAGMLVGFAKDGRERNVIGIDASGTPAVTRRQVLDIARNTAELVELGRDITAADVVLKEDYAYPAYGVPSDETNAAIRLCARLEGMMTDPVYEGKSMQGMIDLVRKGFFPPKSKILYAHLGGVPAINGYSYLYRNG